MHRSARRLVVVLLSVVPSACQGFGSQPNHGLEMSQAMSGPSTWRFAADPTRCVGLAGNSDADGTLVEIQPCNGEKNQVWTLEQDRLKVLGRCAQPALGSLTRGTQLEIRGCDPGSTINQWTYAAPPGTLTLKATGLCVDLRGGNTQAGNAVQIWDCGAQPAHQFWQLGGEAPPPGPTPTPDPTADPAPPDAPPPPDGPVADGPYPTLQPKPGAYNFATDYQGKGPSGTLKFSPSVRPPYPTHRWWSSLAWNFWGDNRHSLPVYAHPLTGRANAAGLDLFYMDTAVVGGDARTQSFMMQPEAAPTAGDLRVGLENLQVAGTQVDGFSDFGVTAVWDAGAQKLRATMIKGSPFVYFKTTGGVAQIRFKGATVRREGNHVLVITARGHHYAAFAPSDAVWQVAADGQSATSDLAKHSYFSVALLPDATPATLQLFAAHAYAFVTDTHVDWRYDAARSEVVTTFRAVVEMQEPAAQQTPLLALYPHQWKKCAAPVTPFTGHSYVSPRGPLYLVETDRFTTHLPYRGILPALPTGKTAERQKLRDLVQSTQVEAAGLVANSYDAGKHMAQYAHLALLADELGLTEKRDVLLAPVKQALTSWFDGRDNKEPLFAYDTKWSTLIGYPAGYGSETELNDHHFHWGYMIMASAVVAMYDSAWAQDAQWGGMVKYLIRDAASPMRGDPQFPFLRTFDPYEGHSWASGHGNFAAGNNQESSSESLNFASAVALWGMVTGAADVRDFGIYLYATQVASTQQYWFDVDNDVFPAAFAHPALGILWGGGGSYATWWTAEPEAIHAINFLPFHGGSLYLGLHPNAMRQNYEHLWQVNGGHPEGHNGTPNNWVDVIWQAQATFDADAAAAKLDRQVDTYPVFDGETRAHTYQWIHAWQALGQIDSTVTASTPAYAVFTRHGVRTYIAFNPECRAQRTTFSDGTLLDVPPRSQRIRTAGVDDEVIAYGERCSPHAVLRYFP